MGINNISIISILIVSTTLLLIYFWYDRRNVSSKEIALISTLAAFAGFSRVPFAAIPSLQPTTFIVIISGYVFGAIPGFMIGSLAAFVSNFFLGHGPWTPWQMMAWGLAGLFAGFIGKIKKENPKKYLLFLSFIWGILFGWFMNLWHFLSFIYPQNLESFLAIQLTSIWFDLIHAFGNVVFMNYLGMDLIKMLNRFKDRLSVTTITMNSEEIG